MNKLIFISSHPIQYFISLYQFLTNKGLDIEIWFGDDSSIVGKFDKEFSTQVKWDIPMLSGYKYRLYKNQAINPTPSGKFFNVVNLNMVFDLLFLPKSILVIPGWQFFTYVLCAFIGRIKGHILWIRCETPMNQETMRSGLTNTLRQSFLKHIYFPLFSKFLFIGTQNKNFYCSMNVPENKMFFTPYSVDNSRFQDSYNHLISKKEELRKFYNIPYNSRIILYSGKYISKKRPLDLLNAFNQANIHNKFLIFLGDGELKSEMLDYIINNDLQSKVLMTGFINQSKISQYYIMSDVFVMCSGIGETWGLSVNEAMNFALPVIVSDTTGSSVDLVRNEYNGYIFKEGDVNDLSKKMEEICNNQDRLKEFGKVSREIVENYSYDYIHRGLLEAMSID